MKLIPLVLLVLASTPSDEKKKVDVVCPLDGTSFKGVRIVQTNQWGGIDKDFCPHAFKTRPLESYVWVCPSCHFAGLRKDYEAGLTEAGKAALRDKLKPVEPIARRAKQSDIPGHVKYDLLAQVRALKGSPDEDVGQAYLYASWSCRQRGAVYLNYFDEWEKVRDKYGFNRTPLQLGVDKKTKKIKNRTDYEFECVKKVEKDLESNKFFTYGVNRRLAGHLGRYLAAYIHRKHGENFEAERWLKELQAMRGENSVIDDAARTMRVSIDCERKFQKKALERYAAAVEKNSLKPHVRAEIAYLVGELYRRLGDPQSSAKWYERSLGFSPSGAIKELVTQQQPKVNVTPTEK